MSITSNKLLFWDTDHKGEVTLSKSPQALRTKVRLSYLLGGQLVIRPAELFEGDLMFESASKKHGDLYCLMKTGQAMLALPQNQTLYERAQWRFGRGKGSEKHHLIHQGRHIIDKCDVEKIEKDTLNRSELLSKQGWQPANLNVFSKKDLDEQSRLFLNCLEMIGRQYFWDKLESTALGMFIEKHQGKEIASRSDLYPNIENLWSKDLHQGNRNAFIRDCKETLTVASALFTANNLGANISELSPHTFQAYCLGAYENKSRFFFGTTLQIVNSIAQSLKKIMVGEDWDKSFAKKWLEMEAEKFVELSFQYISTDDRHDLYNLLYTPSSIEEFEGCSLVERILMKADNSPPIDFSDYIERLSLLRLNEVQERKERDEKGLSWLINVAYSSLGILLPVIPAAKTIYDGFKILRGEQNSADVILAGLRRST